MNGRLFYAGLLFMTTLYCQLFGQQRSRINYELIPQHQVRNFISDHKIDTMDTYDNIRASWDVGHEIASYCQHRKDFIVKGDLNQIWDCYLRANPVDSWNGHFVRFGLYISKKDNTIGYITDNHFDGIETGQVFFLGLRILKGLMNVPVAFEIITVDAAEKIIEFSYIEGNITRGKQILHFIEGPDGRTHIEHSSFFKSGSSLRDHVFYPFFHTKIIKEYHRNMMGVIRRVLKDKG